MSIPLIFILYIFSVNLSLFCLSLLPPPDVSFFPFDERFNVFSLVIVFLFNISYLPLFVIFIPIILGLPYGKKSIKKYLDDVNMGWIKPILKYFLLGSISLIIFLFLSVLISFIGSPFPGLPPIYIDFEILAWIVQFCFILWQEVFFRRVFLTILSSRISKLKSVSLHAVMFSIFSCLSLLIALPFEIFSLMIIPYFILMYFIGISLGYVCIKTNSIIPGILTQIIAFTIGVPLSYNLLNPFSA